MRAQNALSRPTVAPYNNAVSATKMQGAKLGAQNAASVAPPNAFAQAQAGRVDVPLDGSDGEGGDMVWVPKGGSYQLCENKTKLLIDIC